METKLNSSLSLVRKMGSVKNGGHSWLFLCCFLVLVALAECDYDPAHLLNCSYIITVGTLCPKEAATTRPVYIRFGDKDANEVIVRPLNSKFSRRIRPQVYTPDNNASLKPFQACTFDEYRVQAVCTETKICYIYFKLMEEKDDWKVGSVQVELIDDESKRKLSSQEYELQKNIPPKAWNGIDECGLPAGTSAITQSKNNKKKKQLNFFNKKKTKSSGPF